VRGHHRPLAAAERRLHPPPAHRRLPGPPGSRARTARDAPAANSPLPAPVRHYLEEGSLVLSESSPQNP